MVNLKKLWPYLSKGRKKQFLLLFILMMLASLAEVVSLGAVLPFLGVITNPEQVYQYQFLQSVIKILQITSPDQLILPVTLGFIFAVLFAGAIRLILLYVMTRLSYATGADLSINIYRRTLYQEYAVHVARNSSEIINGIIVKTNTVIGGIINPTLNLISSSIITVAILVTLFFINALVASIAALSFGVLYWIVIHFTKVKLQRNSQCIANQSTQMIKSLQEGLGGIRDVLLDGSQNFYCELYRKSDKPLRRASGDNEFINGSPRYFMEAFGMVFIALIAYALTLQENTLATTIPTLGVLALGAQRLLPSLQKLYSSYSSIKGAQSSFDDILDLLGQPLPNYIDQHISDSIIFKKQIQLSNIGFRYGKDTSYVLKNINITIPKGSRVGFIGSTGSGKSTLLDIIMCLLSPTEGQLIVDNQPINNKNKIFWQNHISHVPQNIYLSDGTIEENIAFGISANKINQQQVKEAAKYAQLDNLIEQWKDGYQTIVGERGARLSGGQRQRINIARALYKQKDVIIFDEATSALDNETEQAVMEAIEGLDKELTILIIAHRITTLKNCDMIVKLDQDGGVKIIEYKDIEND
jgi:ATP-binding cassette subfamily B protein